MKMITQKVADMHSEQTHLRIKGLQAGTPSATVDSSTLCSVTTLRFYYKTGTFYQMEKKSVTFSNQNMEIYKNTPRYIQQIKGENVLWLSFTGKVLLQEIQFPISNTFRHRTQFNKWFVLFSTFPLYIMTLQSTNLKL